MQQPQAQDEPPASPPDLPPGPAAAAGGEDGGLSPLATLDLETHAAIEALLDKFRSVLSQTAAREVRLAVEELAKDELRAEAGQKERKIEGKTYIWKKKEEEGDCQRISNVRRAGGICMFHPRARRRSSCAAFVSAVYNTYASRRLEGGRDGGSE